MHIIGTYKLTSIIDKALTDTNFEVLNADSMGGGLYHVAIRDKRLKYTMQSKWFVIHVGVQSGNYDMRYVTHVDYQKADNKMYRQYKHERYLKQYRPIADIVAQTIKQAHKEMNSNG